MKWMLGVLLLLLLALQIPLWFGDASLPAAWRLRGQIEQQAEENAQLQERNKTLQAEVVDLKRGGDAIEERARSELGMIRKGETFFQVIEEKPKQEQ